LGIAAVAIVYLYGPVGRFLSRVIFI